MVVLKLKIKLKSLKQSEKLCTVELKALTSLLKKTTLFILFMFTLYYLFFQCYHSCLTIHRVYHNKKYYFLHSIFVRSTFETTSI